MSESQDLHVVDKDNTRAKSSIRVREKKSSIRVRRVPKTRRLDKPYFSIVL